MIRPLFIVIGIAVFRRCLGLALLLTTLSGCGYRGALYLPDSPSKTPSSESQSSEDSGSPAQDQ